MVFQIHFERKCKTQFKPCDNDELVHYKDSINKADSSLINIETRNLNDLIEIRIKISSKRDFRGFLIKARKGKTPVGLFETQNGTVWKVNVVVLIVSYESILSALLLLTVGRTSNEKSKQIGL